MKSYHGTTASVYGKALNEGFLRGQATDILTGKPRESSALYLCFDPVVAATFAKIKETETDPSLVLEVEFHPETDGPNNYSPDAWQCRVYAPIPMCRVHLHLSHPIVGDQQ